MKGLCFFRKSLYGNDFWHFWVNSLPHLGSVLLVICLIRTPKGVKQVFEQVFDLGQSVT